MDAATDSFMVVMPSSGPIVFIELDKTGIPVCNGMSPLQSGATITTILSRLVVKQGLYDREFKRPKLWQRKVALGRNGRNYIEFLAAVTTEVRLQVPVAGGSFLKAVHTLRPTLAHGKDILDTAVSAAGALLDEDARILLKTLLCSILDVCRVFDTEFWKLTELHEMETGNCLFGNVHLVHNISLWNVLRKEGNEISIYDVFIQDYIRVLFQCCWEVLAPGRMRTYFVPGYSLLDGIRGLLVKKRSSKCDSCRRQGWCYS